LAFKFKLANGTETTDDNHVVHSTDLDPGEIAALKAAVTSDAASTPTVYSIDRFVFERTALGLMDQESLVKGRLVDFIRDRDEAGHVPVISLYETLRGSVFTKSGVTEQFTTTEEFYERKTLCRADIDALVSRAS
jgi:hypothetical protein